MPWDGPWEISRDCTDPLVLNDTMQTYFLEPITGINALKKLADLLEQERQKADRKTFNIGELRDIYTASGFTEDQFERITSVLEKIAVLLPTR